jgi:two-component system, sensor histidine kinase and response regulator
MPVARERARTRQSGSEGVCMSEEHQKRVLIVEDDSALREMMAISLRHKLLQVDEAADGEEALLLLREHRYAVLLLDLVMPTLDGIGLLAELDQVPMIHAPVVLVVTGADRKLRSRLDSQRIHGVVRKPFDPEELATLVRACADIKQRNALGTMCLATMLAGGSILAFLSSKL